MAFELRAYRIAYQLFKTTHTTPSLHPPRSASAIYPVRMRYPSKGVSEPRRERGRKSQEGGGKTRNQRENTMEYCRARDATR